MWVDIKIAFRGIKGSVETLNAREVLIDSIVGMTAKKSNKSASLKVETQSAEEV
jgi:hypothetical protein